MKTLLLRLVIFAAAFPLGAPAASCAAAENDPLVAFGATPTGVAEPRLGRGSPTCDVLDALGEPSVRLTSNIWVYWHQGPDHADGAARGFDTLVIAFSAGRVRAMKIVPHESLEPYVARAAVLDARRALAAK